MTIKNNKTKSLSSVAISTAALYSVSTVVNADLIFNDNGFSVSGNQDVEWDVDGNGTIDFSVRASASSFGSTSSFYNYASIRVRGEQVAGNSHTVSTFGGGTQVVPRNNQLFTSPQVASNTLTGNGALDRSLDMVRSSSFSSTSTSSFGGSNFSSFVDGTGIFGFKVFTEGDADDFFLGWANISITNLGNFAPELTINSWCYSDNNADVHIEDCNTPANKPNPVPAPPIPALLALGLGAAGIRRWKTQRQNRTAA